MAPSSPEPNRYEPSGGRGSECPVCGTAADDIVLELESLPVLPNAIHTAAAEAKAVARGDIRLAGCRQCGHFFNAAFDPKLLEYDASYENSLHFSPTFQAWVTDLAERLVDRHRLAEKTVAELGSGPGDFLVMLCEAGVATGLGFDPSFDRQRLASRRHPGVTISTEPFPTDGSVRAELVCSRHVLEHLADPVEIVGSIGSILRPQDRCYHEVPNGDLMVDHVALWDLIYEHPSYFTAASLQSLIERAGLEVHTLSVEFGGQFLSVEAAMQSTGPCQVVSPDLERAVRFGIAAKTRIAQASIELDQWADGGPVVVWGAGSKGVSYLNLIDPLAQRVAAAVDVNPRKEGTAVSGTGHPIWGPAAIAEIEPTTVVVANPIYMEEIRADVHRFVPDAKVVALWS